MNMKNRIGFMGLLSAFLFRQGKIGGSFIPTEHISNIVHGSLKFNKMYIRKKGYKKRIPKMKQIGNYRVPI